MAITSRSYHPGGVNVFMMDGSCRFIKSTIAQQRWRALRMRMGVRSSARIPIDFAALV
jgi:prepilin-type processing-associated H-X9-DG protein